MLLSKGGKVSSDSIHLGRAYRRLATYILPFIFYLSLAFIGYALFALSQPAFAMLMELFVRSLEGEQVDGVFLVPAACVAISLMRGIGGYLGTMLWAEGVKKAGTHERQAVMDALRSGDIAWDGPAGHMVVDPVTNHVVQDMHVAECQNQSWNIFDSYSQLYPSDVVDRCDLTKTPDMNAHLEPIL